MKEILVFLAIVTVLRSAEVKEETDDVMDATSTPNQRNSRRFSYENYMSRYRIQQNPLHTRYNLQQKIDVMKESEEYNARKPPSQRSQSIQQPLKTIKLKRQIDPSHNHRTITLKDLLQYSENVQNQEVDSKSSGNQQELIEQLQAQLDHISKLRVEQALLEAQQKSMEMVRAKHEALAKMRANAQEEAMKSLNNYYPQNHNYNDESAMNAQHQSAGANQKEIMRNLKNYYSPNHQESVNDAEEAIKNLRNYYSQNHQNFVEVSAGNTEDIQHQQYEEAPPTYSALVSVQQKEEQPSASALVLDTSPFVQLVEEDVNHGVPSSETQYEIPSSDPAVQQYFPLSSAVQHYKVPSSSSSESVDEHRSEPEKERKHSGRYAFGYRIMDTKEVNDFGHEEHREGKSTKGHYHVLLPDGRVQKVKYHADETGYHATVTYESAEK